MSTVTSFSTRAAVGFIVRSSISAVVVAVAQPVHWNGPKRSVCIVASAVMPPHATTACNNNNTHVGSKSSKPAKFNQPESYHLQKVTNIIVNLLAVEFKMQNCNPRRAGLQVYMHPLGHTGRRGHYVLNLSALCCTITDTNH